MAIADAEAIDRRRQAGIWTGLLGGIPISVKDLFDIRGIPTTAGSVVLAGAAPASADAVVVARLRAAGAVIVGRTNMTEFAFSGLGLNPHFGTPASVRSFGASYSRWIVVRCGNFRLRWHGSGRDRHRHRRLGENTGGPLRSRRFQADRRAIPLAGTLPLSMSLNSIGPLGRSVKCCQILDAVLSDQPPEDASRLACRTCGSRCPRRAYSTISMPV